MKGNAWLALQSLDGTEAYTRAGSLTVREDGTLVNHSGLIALGEGGPIQVPPNSADQRSVPTARVSATSGNAPPTVVGKIKLVTPEAPLQRGVDGLFRTAGGGGAGRPIRRRSCRAARWRVRTSARSAAMVAMIAASRQFESQMKLLQAAEADEKAAAQLLSIG